jgi:hypothetical protein
MSATAALCVIAYALLTVFIVMRLYIKKKSRGSVCRASTMLLMMLIGTVDIIWVTIDETRSVTTMVNFINVALILFFIRSIREVWIQFI